MHWSMPISDFTRPGISEALVKQKLLFVLKSSLHRDIQKFQEPYIVI